MEDEAYLPTGIVGVHMRSIHGEGGSGALQSGGTATDIVLTSRGLRRPSSRQRALRDLF